MELPAGQVSCVHGLAACRTLRGLGLDALDFLARLQMIHLHFLKTGANGL
jgi:hypothetical protein